MKRFLFVLVGVVLVSLAHAQDSDSDYLSEQFAAIEQEMAQIADQDVYGGERKRFSLFAIILDGGRLLGIIPREAEASEGDVAEEVSNRLDAGVSATRIYTGTGRILLKNVNEIMEVATAFICGETIMYLPDRVSLTVGFSAGPTVLTSMEWDIDKLC